jgi:hypothetical protein
VGRQEFWTHGVDATVEYPARAQEIRHAGFGTVVKQSAGTENWIHIAVPSAAGGDEDAFLRAMRLRATVNENARIDRIHVELDGSLISSRTVSLTDREIDETYQTADTPVTGGLVLCVHVAFLTGTPIGTITLRSAGATILR